MKQPKRMTRPNTEPLDMDAFIAGADPVAAEAPTPMPAKAERKPTPKPKARPPWEGAGEGKRSRLIVTLSPAEKAMFEFLRDETGVPTAARIVRAAVKEAEAEAKRLWSSKNRND